MGFIKICCKFFSPMLTNGCRFENAPEEFAANVAQCVENSKQRLFDPPPTDDPHYLSFEPYEPAVHDQVKQRMLSPLVSLLTAGYA